MRVRVGDVITVLVRVADRVGATVLVRVRDAPTLRVGVLVAVGVEVRVLGGVFFCEDLVTVSRCV